MNIFIYAYLVKTFISTSECVPALIYLCSASKLQRHKTHTFIYAVRCSVVLPGLLKSSISVYTHIVVQTLL